MLTLEGLVIETSLYHTSNNVRETALTTLKSWITNRLDRTTPSGFELTASLVVAGLGLAFFAGILQGVHETSSVAAFDHTIGQLIIGWRSDFNTRAMETFTGLGGIRGILLLLGLTGVLLFKAPYRQLPAILAFGAVVETIIVVLVKLLVARARPTEAVQLVQATSFSFPSGHTMAAVVIYGLLAYFIGRTFTSVTSRLLIFAGWVIIVASVAISRIYLGVHYPSDTLASACLGAAGLSLGMAWLTRHETGLSPEIFNRYTRNRLFLALALTVLIVAIWRPFFILG